MSLRELIREYVIAELKLDKGFLNMIGALHGFGKYGNRYSWYDHGGDRGRRGDSLRSIGTRLGEWWISKTQSERGIAFSEDEKLSIRNRAIASFTHYMRQYGSMDRAADKVINDILPKAFLVPKVQKITSAEREADAATFRNTET